MSAAILAEAKGSDTKLTDRDILSKRDKLIMRFMSVYVVLSLM
jgi:hypothetical protein